MTYTNKIFEFILNRRKYLALCVKELDDELVCFFVNYKSKSKKDTYKICQSEEFLFNIEYSCVFKINKKHITKHLYTCSCDVMNELKELYSKLPKLSVLREQEQHIREKLKIAPIKEQKKIIKELNELCMQITKRECFFLYHTDKKQNNPYSMHKITPNKDGYLHLVQGGGCTGK